MLKQHTLKNEQFGHDRNFFSKDVEEKKKEVKETIQFSLIKVYGSQLWFIY